MSKFDFSKGIKPVKDIKNKDLSDIEFNKYVFFDKKNLFTFGNGDGRRKESDNDNLNLPALDGLLSEMQAIIYYIDTTEIRDILHVGKYGHRHVKLLEQLFPDLTFHCYQEFNTMHLHQWKMFNRPYLFISDMARDQLKWEDMVMQKFWVETLQPRYSLLSFHLNNNYESMEMQYLDGVLFRPLFSEVAHLLVSALTYRKWNIKNYKEMMNFHQHNIRKQALYMNPILMNKDPIFKEMGLHNDFDSTAMTIIVRDYLKKTNIIINENNIKKVIKMILAASEINLTKEYIQNLYQPRNFYNHQ